MGSFGQAVRGSDGCGLASGPARDVHRSAAVDENSGDADLRSGLSFSMCSSFSFGETLPLARDSRKLVAKGPTARGVPPVS